jgi:hypothetical protein
MSRTALLGFGLLLALCGCSGSSRGLIQKLTPPSGSTNVDSTIAPVLGGGEGVQIDAADRKVVLYDVTAGARQTVAGDVEITGNQLTYHPRDPLAAQHDFELTVERGALSSGGSLDEVDSSESPEEPIQWPYRWALSTSPLPRVRAGYFDAHQGKGRVTVRFSQAMDLVATSGEIKVVDYDGKQVPAAAAVWPDTSTAQLDLQQALDPAQPYRLEVSPRALGQNGLQLNSDRNAIGGQASDTFSAAFTGSQPIILSRQRAAPATP